MDPSVGHQVQNPADVTGRGVQRRNIPQRSFNFLVLVVPTIGAITNGVTKQAPPDLAGHSDGCHPFIDLPKMSTFPGRPGSGFVCHLTDSPSRGFARNTIADGDHGIIPTPKACNSRVLPRDRRRYRSFAWRQTRSVREHERNSAFCEISKRSTKTCRYTGIARLHHIMKRLHRLLNRRIDIQAAALLRNRPILSWAMHRFDSHCSKST